MSAPHALLEEFRPGRRVYLPGATGESLALRALLSAYPERCAGVDFVGAFVPGMNDFDYAGLTPTTTVTTFMAVPAMRASIAAGRVRLTPLPYSGIADYFAGQAEIDVAVIHLAPPDAHGLCSVGVASDFAPLVWPAAKRRIALINPSMPAPRRGPRVALSEADLVVELDGPVMTATSSPISAEAEAVAGHVAALVPDGAAIQFGIGAAPAAALSKLSDRRGLVIRSGLVTDGVRVLAEAGALATDGHVTGLAYGTAAFYRFLVESDLVTFADTRTTHGAPALAGIERFIAINSAIEVDLFGQANLEWRGETMVSGVGGAPDFLRAARRSTGGRAIIALASSAGGGAVSRIVPRLTSPTVSIPREDIDVVVTEHGAAELSGCSLDERAQALIAVAHPTHRQRLAEEWTAMRAKL